MNKSECSCINFEISLNNTCQFQKHSYQILYKGVPQDFEINVCEPWNWAIENIVDDPMISSYCHDPSSLALTPGPRTLPLPPLRPALGLAPTSWPSPAATTTGHRRPSCHHCCHHAIITRISPSSSTPCCQPSMAPDPLFLTAPAPLDPNRHPALYTIPRPCSELLPCQPWSSYSSTVLFISIH